MSTTKGKAQIGETIWAPKDTQETTHFERNAKLTSTQAQRDRILAALQRRPQTAEDLRKLGIFQAAARVKELRDRDGMDIATSLVTLYDREGYMHRRAARDSLLHADGLLSMPALHERLGVNVSLSLLLNLGFMPYSGTDALPWWEETDYEAISKAVGELIKKNVAEGAST